MNATRQSETRQRGFRRKPVQTGKWSGEGNRNGTIYSRFPTFWLMWTFDYTPNYTP